MEPHVHNTVHVELGVTMLPILVMSVITHVCVVPDQQIMNVHIVMMVLIGITENAHHHVQMDIGRMI